MKIYMKKIATFVVATAAIALTASAQETSLRDQLLGVYSAYGQGYEYITGNAVYFQNDNYRSVVVSAGEGEDEVLLQNLFPAFDGFNQTGVLKGTVVATSDYADYGYQGYILVDNGQSVGTLEFSDGSSVDLTYAKTDYSYQLDKENTTTFWVYSDGSIETDCYASAIYPYEYDGTMYDYWAQFIYAKLTRVRDLPSDEDVALCKSLIADYTAAGQGYEYASTGSAVYFNTENYGTVTIRQGEVADEVEIVNLFPDCAGFTQTGALKGRVVCNNAYDGYKGNILVEPGQSVGTLEFSDGSSVDLTYAKTDYSYQLDKENTTQFWIYSDGSVETDCYASAIYPYEYEGTMYDYWAEFMYSKLTPIRNYTEEDAALRDQLLGEYGGDCQGGDYTIREDKGWSALPFSEYNTDTVPAVVVSAGEAANQVVVENIFPKDTLFLQSGLVGTVTYDTTYEGYLGWIEFPTQEVGAYDGKVVTCRDMDYSWNVTDNSTYLWIKESGELMGSSYFCLRYPGEEYDMYLYYAWVDLFKGQVGSVNGIAAESTGATEYYNLNGIRVSGNNLPAGIYVMRQGTKTTKIAVK
jgi:hypothetical protein